jgi:MATE family multidrug resistance protein
LKKLSINREILALSLPAIISNITTPILGMIDVAIVGHLGSAVYLGAIAIGGSMFSMIYWIFNFLRMGTSGLTAQAYGAGRLSEVNLILHRGLSIAFIISAIMLILQLPISDIALYFMDADTTTSAFARQYFLICIWGAPAVLANYAICGWFLGTQDSRTPMWMAILTNIVNIFASLVFVYLFKMKIEGVAMGTLISQWVGVLFGIIILFHRNAFANFNSCQIFEVPALKKFFSLNFDIFLRTLCLVTVTIWFTHAGAKQNTAILGANAILMQLFLFFSFFIDGFAFAGEALAGKYFGQGSKIKLYACIRSLLIWGVTIALLFTLIYSCLGHSIIQLLSSDKLIINTSYTYLPWAIVIPLAGFLAFCWDGIFIGLSFTRGMLIAIIIATISFFTIYYASYQLFGNHGLWAAFIAYLLARGVTQTIYFIRKNKYLMLDTK